MAGFACRLALLGLLVLPGSPTSASGSSMDRTTISQWPPDIVCAGVCPDADVTVWADGRVLVMRHHSPQDVQHFRVSEDEVARFRSILLPYRPASDPTDPDVCKGDEHRDAARVLGTPVMEVTWCEGEGAARLGFLRFPISGFAEAIRQAPWSVQLYIDGRRRD